MFTAIAGTILTVINWRIYCISQDIYAVSKELLDVNIVILQVSKRVLDQTTLLQEKI